MTSPAKNLFDAVRNVPQTHEFPAAEYGEYDIAPETDPLADFDLGRPPVARGPVIEGSDADVWIHPFERSGCGKAPFRVVGFRVDVGPRDLGNGLTSGAPGQPMGTCAHCGTGIKNVYEILSSDGRRFDVGCDCVEKTADAELRAEVKALQKVARAERNEAKRAAIRVKRSAEGESRAAAFLAAHEGLEALFVAAEIALASGSRDRGPAILRDMAARLRKHGALSRAQVEFAMRLGAELAGSIYDVPEPPPVPVPPELVGKRVALDVTLVATKLQEGRYGDTLKGLYLIRTPAGVWKAWGTVPRGFRYVDGRPVREVVKMKATLELSKTDPGFAFLKRPAIVEPK